MRTTKKLAATLSAAVLSLSLAACSGGTTPSTTGASAGGGAASGTISYWLWDANQLPAYQACADAFAQANPGTKVQITQAGWDDYWTKVTNGFVAGTAPDVFTNHLSKYPEFVSTGQLEPLDSVKLETYQPGLADLWVAQDSKRYGVPKDFDTVAVFYNKKLLAEAGVAEADLQTMTWNYDDGGTYEKIAAKLTVDANGKRGDEPGFDKTKVKVYGLGLDGGSGGAYGQTQWAMYTGTTGWQFTDKNPWGTKYNYDDERFQKTQAWMARMIEKGYMPSLAAVTGASSTDIFGAGKYAMVTQGSWMTSSFFNLKDIEVGLAPTPVGPTGKRASMYNGLADSIWVGSKNKETAKKWVEYLGSAACQIEVGKKAVVFPAVPAGTDAAEAAFKAKGIDVSAFLVHVKDQTTFLFPITDKASSIGNIMQPAMDAVYNGQAPVSSLTQANAEVNALLG